MLHIEHANTDCRTWRAAFDHMANARENAGVRHRQPVDHPGYVVVDVDADTAADATGGELAEVTAGHRLR
jgi:hypothetical protein